MPGHELIGVVTEVGSNVKDYKIGDVVGVGCMVESCLSCTSCKRNNEQYCSNSATWTYGSKGATFVVWREREANRWRVYGQVRRRSTIRGEVSV